MSGCALTSQNFDKNYTYGSDNPKGLVALLDIRIKSDATVVLQEVDIVNRRFTGRSEVLTRLNSVRTPAYHMKQIVPGNYAMVLIGTYSTLGTVKYVLNRCNGPILEIFSVKKGRVNSVEVGKLKPGNNMPSPALSRILKDYPKVTAPIGQAKLKGYIDARGLECREMTNSKEKLRITKQKPFSN
ncbi:MAG: hypothetical protein MI743_07185 [Sneathiellales bacterium]|nr:hypothetical protein [Sneathiellales bacterium]